MSIDTGGPAFPQCSYNMKGGYDITGGATLRDYFAAKAMAQLMQLSAPDGHEDANLTAGWAYAYADAMLKARQ